MESEFDICEILSAFKEPEYNIYLGDYVVPIVSTPAVKNAIRPLPIPIRDIIVKQYRKWRVPTAESIYNDWKAHEKKYKHVVSLIKFSALDMNNNKSKYDVAVLYKKAYKYYRYYMIELGGYELLYADYYDY